jgi:tetratricopeptide (TPR) repeat protein
MKLLSVLILRRAAALSLLLPALALAATAVQKNALPATAAPPTAATAAATAAAEDFRAAVQRLHGRWQKAAPSADDPLIRLLAGPPLAGAELQAVATRAARDPLALVLLQGLCGVEQRPPGCPAQAPAVALSAVDPDNALSWIERFNDAVRSGNLADAQASLRRAAQASRYDPRLGEQLKRLNAFAQTIDPGVPLPVVVATVGGALRPQSLAPLLEACRPPKDAAQLPPAVEAQRKQCWALLDTMASRGTDVAGTWTAASVLRRLAVSATEKKHAAALKLRADRLNAAALVGNWATPAARIDLAPQGAWTRYLTDLMAVGEIAAIERALARSGKTLEDIRPELPPPPVVAPPAPRQR